MVLERCTFTRTGNYAQNFEGESGFRKPRSGIRSGKYVGYWFWLLVPCTGKSIVFSGRIVGSLFPVPCSTGSDMFQKGYGGGDPPAFAVGAHCLIPYENKNPIRRIKKLFLYTDCVERF